MDVSNSRRKPWWYTAIQFLLGVALVAGLGILVYALWPRPEPPEGWTIIRPPQDIMTLAEYDGRIWSGGRDGVHVLDMDSGQVLEEVQADVPLKFVTAILINPSEQIVWVGHLNGVSRYDGATWRTYTIDDGLVDNQVLSLGQGENGDLWIGTAHGATYFADDTWRSYTRANGLGSEAVSVIYQDSNGRWWFGNGYSIDGGLSMFDNREWRSYATQDGLAHNMVNAILEDQDGVLWFGTGFSSMGGATSFDGETWTTVTQADGLAGAKVRSLFLDDHGILWVGSEYDGVARLTDQGWRIYTPKEGLSGWEVKVMMQDSRGNFWLGTENGLTRINHKTWEMLCVDLYVIFQTGRSTGYLIRNTQ